MATATVTPKKTKIRPIDDRVLVRPTEPEDRTNSGIFLPEGAKEKPMTGSIVAVGPGKLNDNGSRAELSVKKGDKIVYGKYAGTEVEINGEDLVIIKESELLGVID